MQKRTNKKEQRPPTAFKKNVRGRITTKSELKKTLSVEETEGMRLNKFVAHCGVCSRRAAADLIKEGKVTVNGAIVIEPFYQIKKGDEIRYEGKIIRPEGKKIYILMNKPKNVITTTSDERSRTTVMDIIGKTVSERLFPVGRLDRDTTGLLLLTNDGELAQKLAHPSHRVRKVYQVTLDKPLQKLHMEMITKGVELEDGIAEVDEVDWLEGGKKTEVGVVIHVGKNRIVRRIFEHLGYEVLKLDRVYYAGLTKKDLPRGKFRFLSPQEVIMLKHFS